MSAPTTSVAPAPRLGRQLIGGLAPGIAGMVLVGSSVAVIGALDGLAAFWVQAFRYAVAAVCLVAVLVCTGRRLPVVTGRDLARVVAAVIIGTLSGMVGFNLAVITGNRHAEPAVLGAAVSCIPIVLSIAGPLVRRRRPAPLLVAGATVVAFGAVLVSGWGRTDALGIVMAVALIIGEAGFTLAGAWAMPLIGVWGYSILTCAGAALIFAGIALATGAPSAAVLGVRPMIAIGYLGIVVTAAAFLLWLSAIQRVGPGVAGLASAAAAPASALIGAALGRPWPGLVAWLGMLVIIIGLIVGLGSRPLVASRS